MIQKDSRVTIHYTLRADGEQVDSSTGKNPLTYVQGSGQMASNVEKHLEGLEVGDTRVIVLSPEEGFGLRDPDATLKAPRDSFQNPDSLEVGTIVSGKTGDRTFHASIESLDDKNVTLDLNHPLAGKTLEFTIEVVTVE